MKKEFGIDRSIDPRSALVEQIRNGPSFGVTDRTEESDHSDDECDTEKYREISRVFHLDYLLMMILDGDCVLKCM